MRLSAIVPATDGAAMLDRCLAAILAAEQPPEEVLVVRAPGTPGVIGAGVVSVDSPGFGGPAAARNAGSLIATGEVVVFVDADVAVKPDAFVRLRSWFDGQRAHPVDAVFGSYCDRPDAPGLVSGFRNLLHHHVHQDGEGPAETFWTGLGAIRRSTLVAVGGLDEGVRYLEDLELGRRLVAGGASIVLDAAVQGTHLKGYTLRTMVRTDLLERAIPWVRLALEGRASTRALNAGGRHRASAAASVAVAAGALGRRPRVAAAGAAGMLGLNHRFYALLARRLGMRGALLGAALHVVHHLTALSGILPAVLQHVVQGPRVRVPIVLADPMAPPAADAVAPVEAAA